MKENLLALSFCLKIGSVVSLKVAMYGRMFQGMTEFPQERTKTLFIRRHACP